MSTTVNSNFAGKLILAAVEAGNVKLLGPGSLMEDPKARAKHDAEYLKELLTSLITEGSLANLE